MTAIVGIVNVTPDSFSGDGKIDTGFGAKEKIIQMIRDGADIIDIGAESTRPGATLLSPQEEWQRLEPVIETARKNIGQVGFSLDTRHSETAEKFITAIGTDHARSLYINDVSGGRDSAIIDIARQYNVNLVLTHSLTVPADPKVTIAADEDAVQVVYAWASEILNRLGGDVIIDPGIGFGKTPEQSFAIIKNIAKLKSLGTRVMVGHSRKSFLSLFTDKPSALRDPETVLFSDYLAGEGVDYLRVHDVKSHVAMLKIRQAL